MEYTKLTIFLDGRFRTVKVYTYLLNLFMLKQGIDPDEFESESRVSIFLERAFETFNFDKDDSKNRERFSYHINKLIILSIADRNLFEELYEYHSRKIKGGC